MSDDQRAPVLREDAEAQTVTITLSDGRTGSFVGPVLLTPQDGQRQPSERVGVKSIHFSTPFLLQTGVFFVQRDDGNLALAQQANPPGDPLEG